MDEIKTLTGIQQDMFDDIERRPKRQTSRYWNEVDRYAEAMHITVREARELAVTQKEYVKKMTELLALSRKLMQ